MTSCGGPIPAAIGYIVALVIHPLMATAQPTPTIAPKPMQKKSMALTPFFSGLLLIQYLFSEMTASGWSGDDGFVQETNHKFPESAALLSARGCS